MIKHLLILWGGCVCFMTQGQSLTVDGIDLSITANTLMYVDADVINKGTLTNEGELVVTGSWMNVGNYVSAAGELVLNSADPQVINHNAQTFQRLTIRGGGDKQVMNDLQISSALVFESGRILVDNMARMTLQPGVNVSGADNDNYIIGAMYWEGTGTLVYPIGTATEYLPVTLAQVNDNISGIGMIAYSQGPPQEVASPLRAVSNNRYWQMIPSINFTGATIVLPLLNEPFLREDADALIAETPNLGDPFSSLGGTLSNGQVSSAAPAFGGYYAIGAEDIRRPPIRVVNAVTPGLNDGKHDHLQIDNIEFYENNRVDIYDRTGRLVYRQENYNNLDRAFVGFANTINDQRLGSGTYYYSIELRRGEVESGFVYLKF